MAHTPNQVRIVSLHELRAAGWRTPLVLLGTGAVRDLCQAASPSDWAAGPLVPPPDASGGGGGGAKQSSLLQRAEALVQASHTCAAASLGRPAPLFGLLLDLAPAAHCLEVGRMRAALARAEAELAAEERVAAQRGEERVRIEVGAGLSRGVGLAHGVPPPQAGPAASAFGLAHGVLPPPGPPRPPQPQELGLLRHQIQLEMAEGLVAAHAHEEVAVGVHRPGGARPPPPTGPAQSCVAARGARFSFL